MNVLVERLDFSGELHTLLLQLLTFLHVARNLELFSTDLVYTAPQGLDLLLLVLDQFPFQLDLTAGYTQGALHGDTVMNRDKSGVTIDFISIWVFDIKYFMLTCPVV